MDVAVCAGLTGIWWASSATVLLPFLIVLKCNKFLRDKWFSFFFLRVLKPIFEPSLKPLRIKAFDLLKANLPERKASNPHRILEIGIGAGANLALYPDHSYLTALDMNPSFESHFRTNQAKYPQIKFDRLVTAYAEDMKEVDDSSMDVVVSTYVLCSAKSVDDCLKEIKRVLKPGGKFLFLEHVAHPKSDWSFSLQKLTNPLWSIFFDGCNLTRTISDDIRNAGFGSVEGKIAYPKSLMVYVRPQAFGLATKKLS